MHRIKRFAAGRNFLALRLTAILGMLFLTAFLFSQAAFAQNTFVITDGSRVLVHTTYATDPAQVLDEAGLALGEEDTYTTQAGNGVSEIIIKRIQMVTIDNGGELLKAGTYGETVGQLLNRLEVSLDGNVQVSHDLQAATADGMHITVTRITYGTVEYTQALPFDTVYCTDSALEPGEEIVLTPGRDGKLSGSAYVKYENGQELSRVTLSEYVLEAPVNQVVARGIDRANKVPEGHGRAYNAGVSDTYHQGSSGVTIAGGTITTASGEVLTYSRILYVSGTAYTCEGHVGTTATGTVARYGAIAVDPTVIPYGTRMYVVSGDGEYDYGVCTAEDCGGGIKGNKVDLYFDTFAECYAFGCRPCIVYILD